MTSVSYKVKFFLPLLSAAPFPNMSSFVLLPFPTPRSVPLHSRVASFHINNSVLLARARRLPLSAQRGRSANLCSRIHHHLPVLPPRRASPVGHPDSRVARRAERVGRGGQGHCFPRSGCHATSTTTHGSPVVYRSPAKPFFPRRKTDAMIVCRSCRALVLSESNVVPNKLYLYLPR